MVENFQIQIICHGVYIFILTLVLAFIINCEVEHFDYNEAKCYIINSTLSKLRDDSPFERYKLEWNVSYFMFGIAKMRVYADIKEVGDLDWIDKLNEEYHPESNQTCFYKLGRHPNTRFDFQMCNIYPALYIFTIFIIVYCIYWITFLYKMYSKKIKKGCLHVKVKCVNQAHGNINECVVCLDNKQSVLIKDCGHNVLCEKCYKEIKERGGGTCPLCYGTMNYVQKGVYTNEDYIV